MLKLLPYLKLVVDKGASDLYFTANALPMVRIEGLVYAVGETLLTRESVKDLVDSILTPEQQTYLAENLELDLATEAGGLGRFRVNVYHQRGTLAMVMRHIRAQVPRLVELTLPAVLADLVMLRRGFLLMVGPTGCGKTTSLAAMIRHRNENTAGHILSIEDPIEFVHSNYRSMVSQREVGLDTKSYERALHSSLREAPDVVFIGEVRRRETMDACMQLANTGHLAISTMHANNCAQALQRIVNLYPGEMRNQLMLDISMTLRAVVSQRLVRGKDGKRKAAVEVMVNTPYVADLIAAGRIGEIRDAMEQNSSQGSQTFDDSLLKLYRDDLIDIDEALVNADSRSNLEARINFGA